MSGDQITISSTSDSQAQVDAAIAHDEGDQLWRNATTEPQYDHRHIDHG
jgi:hypothetical protein